MSVDTEPIGTLPDVPTDVVIDPKLLTMLVFIANIVLRLIAPAVHADPNIVSLVVNAVLMAIILGKRIYMAFKDKIGSNWKKSWTIITTGVSVIVIGVLLIFQGKITEMGFPITMDQISYMAVAVVGIILYFLQHAQNKQKVALAYKVAYNNGAKDTADKCQVANADAMHVAEAQIDRQAASIRQLRDNKPGA